VSGGPFVQITFGAATKDYRARWSSDGTALYFLSTRGSPPFLQNVWASRFDPQRRRPLGAPFPVTAFNSAAQLIFEMPELKVVRDHIVLPIRERSGNIWMLENVR
jgi:WD40-like Beta Propeller Repeat